MRAARLALELTPEQVAAQLKLAVRQVNAIEQEAFSELPSNLFIRGFVRNYARLVQIDAEPLLAYLAEVLPEEGAQAALPELAEGISFAATSTGAGRSLLPVGMLLIGLLLGLGAVYWYLQQPAHPELALPEVNSPPVLEVASSPVAIPVVASSVAAASAVNAVVTASAVASSAAASSASAVAAVEIIRVTTESDSWVQVVDSNGTKVLSEIVRPGFERTADGRPPFSVKIGNAPKTTLYFNGLAVDLKPYLKSGSDVVNLELK